jgi:hypothetical protein
LELDDGAGAVLTGFTTLSSYEKVGQRRAEAKEFARFGRKKIERRAANSMP